MLQSDPVTNHRQESASYDHWEEVYKKDFNKHERNRHGSQQMNAWFQIMFSLSKACETLISNKVHSSSFPLKAKLGTGQPSIKAWHWSLCSTAGAVDSIPPSKAPSSRRGHGVTDRTSVPRQSGDGFQWQSKENLYYSQTATFFHPGSSPSYLQAHVFVRFIFSVCSRNLSCCTQRAASSDLPLAAKIPNLPHGSFSLPPFPGSYSILGSFQDG